jgi:hypothetical protein
MRYRVAGRAAATTATADRVLAAIWNPSSTRRIYVKALHVSVPTAPGAGAGLYLRKITARGTATLTKTPNEHNSDDSDVTPPSGFLLDLTYSAEPTLQAGAERFRWSPVGAIGANVSMVPERGSYADLGIAIPPGTGLALCNSVAVIFPASDVSAVVDD